jgi:hypothetical protein
LLKKSKNKKQFSLSSFVSGASFVIHYDKEGEHTKTSAAESSARIRFTGGTGEEEEKDATLAPVNVSIASSPQR